MSVDVTLLIFYLCLALGVSFLCSVLEAVLLSITPGYVAALEKQGDRVADGLKKLKEEVDRPLSAILSLNTIAHTVGAAGVASKAPPAPGAARRRTGPTRAGSSIRSWLQAVALETPQKSRQSTGGVGVGNSEEK